MKLARHWLGLVGLLAIASGHANPFTSSYTEDAKESPDLVFSSPVEFSGKIESNTVFMAKGVQGKAPAVVLLHNCSGIKGANASHLAEWTSFLTQSGFHVLVVDHLGPRAKDKNCGAERTVSNGRLAKDLFDATDYLSKLPSVDGSRIFSVGFSLGGMTGGLAASQNVYDQVGLGRTKPRAVVSIYGGCHYPQVNRKYLHEDSMLPVLWVMGGKDLEAPTKDCESTFATLSGKRADFKTHVYSDLGHCWDCKALDGFTKRFFGQTITYRYNEAAHRDSEQRVLAFLNQFK